MASTANRRPPKPRELITLPETDVSSRCRMCLEVAKPPDGIELGPLYEYGNPVATSSSDVEVYRSHYFCLLFSSGLEQRGEDEDAGMKGFLPEDVLREWRRGQRLKCFRCGKNFATAGCCASRCRKTFHLPCAVRSGALLQFCDRFSVYCGDHRPRQGGKPVPGDECAICREELETSSGEELLRSPCCRNWFHKPCVDRFAASSGYFFRCPHCNNKEEFEREMMRFGVHVPQRDAAWEEDGGGQFRSLLERHDTCDAERCLCPEGRKRDEDYTQWEIILCRYCGARGVHVTCGGLPLVDSVKWKCDPCKEVVARLPPKTIHRFRPVVVNRKKPSNRLNRLLRDTSIVLSPDDESVAFRVRGRRSRSYVVSGSVGGHHEMPGAPVFKVGKEDREDHEARADDNGKHKHKPEGTRPKSGFKKQDMLSQKSILQYFKAN